MTPSGGSTPKAQPRPSPTPQEVAPEVAIAKANERERLRRAKGRAFSQTLEPKAAQRTDANIFRRTLGGA